MRTLQIDAKFKELRLGLVDGLVSAVAERRVGRREEVETRLLRGAARRAVVEKVAENAP